MGAAWRSPKDRDLDKVCAMVEGGQGARDGDLRHARHADRRSGAAAKGLRPRLLQPQSRYIAEYYGEIITTRTYQDRLDTLEHVRNGEFMFAAAGLSGMGEGPERPQSA